MRRSTGLLAACSSVLLPVILAFPHTAAGQGAMPPGFVYLRDIDGSIAQDIRYAGYDNFVGRPLPGYDAPECIVQRDVALALKRAQASLAASGLSLKVYDCYRPARAVRAMAAWANDGRGDGPTRRFFPKLHKGSLFGSGYIAWHSRHSGGIAVDLTLVQTSSPAVAPFDPRAGYGACTAPAAERSPDNSVDMGTSYDCLDAASQTHSTAISLEQRKWRRILLSTMAAQGFWNYSREWWHYSYARERGTYDFPIRPRTANVSGQ